MNKLKKRLSQMQKDAKITKSDCDAEMRDINDRRGDGDDTLVSSVVAQCRADDVWKGVQTVLYSDGKHLNFKHRGDLPPIRAKQYNKEIVVKLQDGELVLYHNQMRIPVKAPKKKDYFLQDELDAVKHWLSDPKGHEKAAVNAYYGKGILTDTYRVCYASLICKQIRGKLRVFIQLTLEGKPKQKYDRFGNHRHTYGTGHIGNDIGTQTVAYRSQSAVGLENLAERQDIVSRGEKKEKRIARAMERSRRATNPQNYNKDGTIKKGAKKWMKSKRYRKLRMQYADTCRKNAESRKDANNQLANCMRSLGDVLITEPKNAKKLQRTAKPPSNPEDAKDKRGRTKRRKRFGHSIRLRCPGYYQSKVKQVFEDTGGTYIETPADFRASQYDHTADDYIKKPLSTRVYTLHDGHEVQRDMYSSFLMSCIDEQTLKIDKEMASKEAEDFYEMEEAAIKNIRRAPKKIYNSGICQPFVRNCLKSYNLHKSRAVNAKTAI